MLTIPNKVTNIHNNAGTFKPYNPGEAIGDTSPTLPVAPNPPVKKKGCGGLLSIFVAVIAIVATIYTAGAFAVAAGATGGTFAAGVTALGSGTLGFGAAAVAGAVGSIAGQVAGIALGVQDKFSWGAVAAGAIGAGIGASGVLGSIAGGNVVGQAIAGNIINQGVGIITGAQKGFSWAGVAAAAIAAPITSSIGKSIKDSNFGGAGAAGYAIRGAAAGIATSTVNELTRVALVGGKLSWASVAIGGISGGIYGYGEGLANQRSQAGGTGIQLTEEQGNRLTKGIKIPELEDRPITYGLTATDVENFQLKTTVGGSSEDNRNGLSVTYLNKSPVKYSADQYMVDKVRVKSAQNKVADNFIRLNDFNFDVASVNFISNRASGNGRIQSTYWGNISDEGVNQGSFAKYAFGNTMGALEKVGYGIYNGVAAAINNPKDGFKGARNMAVNLGPDLFNLAVNGTKTSLNGYSMLFEQSGLVGNGTFSDFRNTQAYNINPLLANENQGQNGGYLLGGLALGKVVGSYGGYGVAFEDINATGPLKYQAGAVNLRLTGPAFATTAEATAAAEALGYSKTGLLTPNKQAIYVNNEAQRDLRYISRDVDGHNGGAWKAARSPENFTADRRVGTFNADLSEKLRK